MEPIHTANDETIPHDSAERASVLQRLPMVRAGPTDVSRDETLAGTSPIPLSDEGRRQVESLSQFWEWADVVVASPVLRARETAEILARGAPVRLDVDLRPRDLGRWQGISLDELRADYPDEYERWKRDGEAAFDLPDDAESSGAFADRIARFLERAHDECGSLLVVSHQSVIRAIAAALLKPLPPGRPSPAEMVLLTRRAQGRWDFGRNSSDPPALRSPLERTGLSGTPNERPRERHMAPLEISHDV